MKQLTRYLILIFAVCLIPASSAFADKDKDDDDKDKKARQSEPSAVLRTSGSGPDPGQCTLGLAQKDLDVNNVRARLFNIGSIGYGNGAEAQYIAPKASGHSPIYAMGIWIGGMAGDNLRVAGSRYDDFEFWPGPLGPDGRPVNPNDCSAYDRLYKVSRSDVQNYEATGQAASDLADWPYDLGAPVIDGDGTEGNYNLAGGDRPDLIGDQAVWWIMNDVGNAHQSTQAAPIGVEVRVHAFGFNRGGALGDMTFFKYNVTYKGDEPLTDTYFSIFSDPDLGDAADDFVGVDTTLSLGYVYNDTATDDVYGPAPAAGYDFFQGPISEDGDTLGVTSFMYFINTRDPNVSDPSLAQEIYNVQQGFWKGGQPLTANGLGYQTGGPETITKFAYPGDPVTGAFWSEVNSDGNGARNQSGDRRLVVSTGPFTLEPGDSQDIVFGVVFAQGADNLSSISALRDADAFAQSLYDVGFNIPSPPPPPPLCNPNSSNAELHPGSGNCLYASELDGQAHLVWGYPSTSENYLGSFDAVDSFLAEVDVDDKTYTFEGFNIYRYPTSSFASDKREYVATFDIANGVKKVTDPVYDGDVGDFRQQVSARGTDSGLQYNFPLLNLTNYTDYYYGVSAYAYSPNSTPKVLESPPTDITIRPSRIASTMGGSSLGGDVTTTDSSAVVVTQNGQGVIMWRVVDPAQLKGSDYTVQMFDVGEECSVEEGQGVLSYSIMRESDGHLILDGCAHFNNTGEAYPEQKDVIVADGIAFSVSGPAPSFRTIPGSDREAFMEITGPGGNPACTLESDGSYSGAYGCALLGGDWIYGSYNSTSEYVVYGPTTRSFERIGLFAPNDFEIRFTERGSYAFHPFTTDNVMWVPFEVWDIGPTSGFSYVGDNDPADDVQLIPNIFSDNGGECEFNVGEIPQDPFGLGWTGTDRIYAYYATNGYDQWEAAVAPVLEGDDDGCLAIEGVSGHVAFGRNRPLQREIIYTGFEDISSMEGTVIRFLTTKSHLAGDVFRIATAGIGRTKGDTGVLEASIDDIGIVPNPYRGRSAYETGNEDRRTRFTNMPQTATIRIYTVSGTLVRTLYKDGPSTSLDWNLTTDSNLPVASGMYFIHIDVPGVGEKVMKFGVINRETNINIF